MAYHGECSDPVLKAISSNVGECELACMNDLRCQSVTFTDTGNSPGIEGICNLRTGPCSTITTGSSLVFQFKGEIEQVKDILLCVRLKI